MTATALTTTVQPPVTHPKTGLPVESVATFSVGDYVTEAFMSDGYPAVVVAVEGKGKTVYVRRVRFQIGNVTEHSHARYLDDTTLVIDPESVEQALAAGKGEDASKYVLRVGAAFPASSIRQREEIGETFHRAKWAIPGSRYGSIQPGARYRIDPHV